MTSRNSRARNRLRVAGAVYMPAPQTGGPMTYMLSGKQYIVVSIAGANYTAELVAFRLPG